MLFYISINVEVLIYCFFDEYLRAKVSFEEKITAFINLRIPRSHIFLLSEQNYWKYGVKFSLIDDFQSQRKLNCIVPYCEVEKIDNHKWKNRRPFFEVIYQRKI